MKVFNIHDIELNELTGKKERFKMFTNDQQGIYLLEYDIVNSILFDEPSYYESRVVHYKKVN
jgi:hypothetical protein